MVIEGKKRNNGRLKRYDTRPLKLQQRGKKENSGIQRDKKGKKAHKEENKGKIRMMGNNGRMRRK